MCGRAPRDPKTWACFGEGLLGSGFLSWWVGQTVEAVVDFSKVGARRFEFSVNVKDRPAVLNDRAQIVLSQMTTVEQAEASSKLDLYETNTGKILARQLAGTIEDGGNWLNVRLAPPLRLPDNLGAKFGFSLFDPLGRDMAHLVEAAIGALYLQTTGRFEPDTHKSEDARKGSKGIRSCENCVFHHRIPRRDDVISRSNGSRELVDWTGKRDPDHHHAAFYRWEPASVLPAFQNYGIPSGTSGWQWPRHVCTLRLMELDRRIVYEANHDRHFPHETYESLQARYPRRTEWEDEAVSTAEHCPHHHYAITDRGSEPILEGGRPERMYTKPELPYPAVEYDVFNRAWQKVTTVELDPPVVHLPGFIFCTKRSLWPAVEA